MSEFVTPWTVVRQAPLCREFSRQEYWSGLLFPTPVDLPDQGIEPVSLASPDLAGGLYHSATWEGNTGKLFLEDLVSILVKDYSICYKMIAIKYDREHTHKQNKLYFQFPKSSIDEHEVYYVFQIQESQKHST